MREIGSSASLVNRFEGASAKWYGIATVPGGTVSEITARVVSMVEIAPAKQRSLGAWLQRVSPVVAAALAHYELRPAGRPALLAP